MFLSGALFALFLTGCWLYCLTDAILTPAPEVRGLSKRIWVTVVAVTFVGGAFAWLIARRPVRESAQMLASVPDGAAASDDEDHLDGQQWTAADDAVARHPAGRARVGQQAPKGPDDDQEFLRELDRTIRGGNPPVSLGLGRRVQLTPA
ncbi:MAG: hypothetical protein ACRDOB_03285 [Streptosporangiaceae bacterium]